MIESRPAPSALMTTLLIVLVGAFPCIGSQDEETHQPITLELMELIENNPEIGTLLEESIARAQESNPNPETNPVRTLDDYYSFIDHASQSLPQNVISCSPELSMRDRMLQGICYFYFLVSQPLPALEDRGLFSNSIEYYEPFASWLRDFAVVQGQYMDTGDSWNEGIYQEILGDSEFGLQGNWYEDPSNWNTFNRFFSRYLSSPEVRPVASPEESAIVVSPADCVPQGVWGISAESEIEVEEGLTVKMMTYYSVHDLLGSDSEYRDAFANGELTHAFLNVSDYHRYHFAVGGEILETRNLTRNVALEVSWDEEQEKYIPLDSTGWQFSQTLGYAIVDTGEFGLVALIPMGMAMVSSVNFEDYVAEGYTSEKGEMLGYFLFGGSDFIILFQEEAGFHITAPMDSDSTYGHILVGEEYGRMAGIEQ